MSGLRVAIFVGILLNLINQGSNIFAGNWDALSWPKMLLTFCVPYCVSVYSGTQAKRAKAE
ncbi:MAG: hypothetical protein ACI8UO_004862 [Verrucomicrobiales bacterium]|jgi:hypothetical protein